MDHSLIATSAPQRRRRLGALLTTAVFATLSLAAPWSAPAGAVASDNGAASFISPSAALNLVVGDGWSATVATPPAFFWGGGAGSFATDSYSYLTPFFTTLSVTDDFQCGDEFRIYDNGVPLGVTTSVATDASCTQVGPDAAFASAAFSHGEFLVAPGAHTITIELVESPFGGGRGYLRADVTEDQFSACSGGGQTGVAICKTALIDDANGNGIFEVGELLTFNEVITVHNFGASTATNVVVKDNWGGDIDVLSVTPSQGTATLTQSGTTQKEKLSWNVGTLLSGATATLTVVAVTDINPGGHQEYTSCGTHTYNSGANVKWVTGGHRASAVTGSITLRVWCEGQLLAGTDHEEFSGAPLPDRLLSMDAIGPFIVGETTYPVSVYINGLGEAPGGNLFAGDPSSNALHVISPTGAVLSSTTGPYDGDCCQEDFAFDGTHVWRADYGEGPLWKFLPDGTPVASYAQTDVVGAAFVGSTLWLSKWGASTVGTFDPATNTYTPKFTTPDFAGGLAYDAANNLLWVGLRGGTIQAYDLSVSPPVPVGPGYTAFAPSPHTADGLAFIAG